MKVRTSVHTEIFSWALPAFLLSLSLTACEEDAEPFREVPQDGFWETASPASQDMDETALGELGTAVSASDGVYSFLVVRNGKIVHEQYHNGANENSLLHARSVTKRVTATLTGIAIDRGDLLNEDVPIADFFPEVAEGTGQGWNQVSVHHLLNMVSGMDWVENDDLNAYEDQLGDPLSFIFSKDIVHEPETYYAYNTPGIDLLPYVVERASGTDLTDFTEDHLFGPLGILGHDWEQVGDGMERGGAGLQLTARDLAKVGLLYLRNGQWEGQQIISEEWIQQCFTDVIPLDNIEGDHLPGISIGQTWWTRNFEGERIHYGDGYGGQVLLVVPKYDLVIVMNRAYKVEPGKNNAAFGFFFSEVLPGVLDSVVK